MNDGMEKPLTLAVCVSRNGDEMLIDFDGTDPAVERGINVPLAYTTAYATYAVKCVVAPEVPNNHGSFVPIHVQAPLGSLLNPAPPAPTAARHILGHYLPSVIYPALAKALHDRVPADSAAGLWVTQVSGKRVTGEPFSFAFFSVGGMGARHDKDGLSTTSFPSGIQNVSTEIIESVSPVLFRKRELRPDSGGAGRYRGGLGQTIEFEVRAAGSVMLSAMYDRIKDAPRGTEAGGSGAGGVVIGEEGRQLAPKGRSVLKTGERVHLELPGGGGYGDPRDRDPAALAKDIELGFVSREAAKRDYGKAATIAEAPTSGLKRAANDTGR